MSVILNAPAVFRFTAQACPERHLVAAEILGADVSRARPEDAGKILSDRLVAIMQRLKVPNGLRFRRVHEGRHPALVQGTLPQARVTKLSPRRWTRPISPACSRTRWTAGEAMKIRAAVVQAAPVVFDRARTVDKLGSLVAEAARQRAELVVFPRRSSPLIPRASISEPCRRRTREGREQFRRYFESAVEVPGPDVDRMAKLARDHRLHLVVGVIERDGGTLYCTVLFFADDGAFLGKHRKLMPTAAERLVWGFGDGSTLPVFGTRLGRIGAVICWRTTCRCCARRCTRKECNSIARRTRRSRPGCRRAPRRAEDRLLSRHRLQVHAALDHAAPRTSNARAGTSTRAHAAGSCQIAATGSVAERGPSLREGRSSQLDSRSPASRARQ